MSHIHQRRNKRRKRPRSYQYDNPLGRQINKQDIAQDDSTKPIFTGPHYGYNINGHRDLMGWIRLRGIDASGQKLDESKYHLINELDLNHRMNFILALTFYNQIFVYIYIHTDILRDSFVTKSYVKYRKQWNNESVDGGDFNLYCNERYTDC